MVPQRPNEIGLRADLLDKQSDIIASVYADRTGQPAEFWRERMADDSWYNAEEALAAGLVDEIEGQEKKTDDAFDLTVFAHAGRDKAPAPDLENQGTVDVPPVEPKEPVPFVWDFAAFAASLKEGIRG